jgi:hypothetical protein
MRQSRRCHIGPLRCVLYGASTVKRARLWIGTLAGMGLFGGLVAAPVSAGTLSPGKVVAEAAASGIKAGSARVTVQYVTKGLSGKIVEDSTASSGTETIAIGNERVSILLTGGTVYILSNDQGLTSYFGFPSSAASAFSDRWISIKSTDKGYQELVSDVALSSAIKAATPTGVLMNGNKATLSGQAVDSISGAGPTGQAKMVLFVASKGTHLPVEAVVSSGSAKKGSGEIIKFSHWGEKVKVLTPAGATPISTLGSPQPAG